MLPHLTYGILVWGYESKLIVFSNSRKWHWEPPLPPNIMRISILCLKKSMYLLKVDDIHTVHQLIFLYNLAHNNQHISTRFLYGTVYMNTLLERYIGLLLQKFTTHSQKSACIRYSVFKTVNDTSTQIIDKMYAHSLQGVASYAKHLLIHLYDVRCCMRDCYICK